MRNSYVVGLHDAPGASFIQKGKNNLDNFLVYNSHLVLLPTH